MAMPQSDFLRTLSDRGFVHQCTDLEALDAKAKAGPLVAYIGFDCTAPSLHVGSLVSIMLLRHLQKSGHKPIVLMGGGTTKVGDPAGKDEQRKLLDDAAIAANMAGIKQAFAQFLQFGEGASDAVMVNNDDWLGKLQYVSFLRDYGRHFSVNRMLTFDSVKLRLEREQALSFLEFNYMILQAYDFLELSRRYGCALQMGGSDQWGNIVNGVELGRRVDDAALFGLTTPLITLASGAKMGKSVKGAVWLNADQLPAFEYWQFWRNTEDADVGRFLKLFTELPLMEIAKLEALQGQERNEAKKILATEATALCHGRAMAEQAAATARQTFEQKHDDAEASAHWPVQAFTAMEFEAGLSLAKILVTAGVANNNAAAKSMIADGAVRLNEEIISDPTAKLTRAHLGTSGEARIAAGKKRRFRIRAAD